MASRSWLLILALVLSFLGTVASASSNREERFANRITQLTIQVEDLKAASKIHAASLQSKDKETRTLKKELQQFHAKLAAATKTTSDLNHHIPKLKKELDRAKVQNSKLLKRAEIAEAQAHAFKLEASDMPILVETINEYKSQLKKAERALQVVHFGMLQAQKDAADKAREVAVSADAWLPPWLSTQTAKLHSLVTSTWSTHGESLLGHLRASQAPKFSKPYMRSFSRNVQPVIRSQWKKVRTLIVPQLQRLKMLGMQYLEAGKKYLSPHLSKVQENEGPYVQTVRMRSQPFVDQADDFLSPHFEKANAISGSSVQKANGHSESVVTQASTSHEELQDSVKGTLGKHEVLTRWATKELIWFLASALLVLPVVASLLVFSSVFETVKNPIKPQRRSPSSCHTNTSSGNRKPCQPKLVDVKQEK